MGIAKQLMLEMEEAQWEETEIPYPCPTCQRETDAILEVPVVYENGDLVQLPVSIRCLKCHENFDGWVKTDWNTCRIELDDHPDVEIKINPARGTYDGRDYDYESEYYEWLEQQETLTRPIFGAFRRTLEDVESMTSRAQLDQQFQMLARMLLAQCITALEVFLADTLIQSVANRKDAQLRLLKTARLNIGNIQFKLSDAIGIEDFSKHKLIEHLRAISFHNLHKVAGLFKVGLGIDTLPEGKKLELLQTAIRLRHDCVHRNGVDRESGKLHQIEKALIFELTETLLEMARAIDDRVQNLAISIDKYDEPFV